MLFSIIGALSAGEFRKVKCDKVHVGRYVAISFDHSDYLTVCELEVYGGKHFSLYDWWKGRLLLILDHGQNFFYLINFG